MPSPARSLVSSTGTTSYLPALVSAVALASDTSRASASAKAKSQNGPCGGPHTHADQVGAGPSFQGVSRCVVGCLSRFALRGPR